MARLLGKRVGCWLVLLVALGTLLVGAVGGGAVGALLVVARQPSPQPVGPSSPISIALAPTPSVPGLPPVEQRVTMTEESATIDVVHSVSPAVVTVINQLDPRADATVIGRSGPPAARGSGVIIDPRGYAVTNWHVIEGAQGLSVIMASGEARTAALVGADYPFTDLAVIKIDGDGFSTAQLGDSGRLAQGQMVVAIGSALGDLRNTATRGIVSGLNRMLPGEDLNMEGLIQTDAAINHGNSGGPLVNMAGQVVGINTAIIRSTPTAEQAEGIGFAIPSETVRLVADQVIRVGRVVRPFLGVSHRTISPSLASAYGLPVRHGIYITRVEAASPAGRAGVRERDIVVALGEDVIDNEHPFLNLLMKHRPGESIPIRVNRNGEELTVEAVLVERPQR